MWYHFPVNFGHRALRISLLVWLLAAPGIGAVVRFESADAGWGLVPDSRPSEMERGCHVDPVFVRGVAQAHVRTLGGGPGLVAWPGRGSAAGLDDAAARARSAVMADGRDTHLRLAVLLI